jgi:hypothetical protein
VLARRELAARVKNGSATAYERGIHDKIKQLNLEPTARIVSFIDRPGSTGLDMKWGERVEVAHIADSTTTGIALQQGWGRGRATYRADGQYGFNRMHTYLIDEAKVVGERVSVSQLRAMLTVNDLTERKWLNYETAREAIAMSVTNQLNDMLRHARTPSERKALAESVKAWQDQKHLSTDMSHEPLSAMKALESTYESALGHLAKTQKELRWQLSRENRQRLSAAIKDTASLDLGRGSLTALDAVRLKTGGGLYGAMTPGEAVRFVNAKLSAADLPSKVGQGRDPHQTTAKVAAAMRVFESRLQEGKQLDSPWRSMWRIAD